MLLPNFELNRQNNVSIIDTQTGDVTGDGIIDVVYLVGTPPNGPTSPFYDNLAIVVQDGRTGNFLRISPESNAGYTPLLFLGDFTNDRVADIYLRITSGGSGGYGYFYIYTLIGGVTRKIFDYEQFNQQTQYTVRYQDNYTVRVVNETTQKTFLIDLSNKDPEYLSELYDKNGKLKKPVEGSVLGVDEVFPVDVDADKVYELLTTQRIIGRYNAETLGYVETFLRWNGVQFQPFNQWVAIP